MNVKILSITLYLQLLFSTIIFAQANQDFHHFLQEINDLDTQQKTEKLEKYIQSLPEIPIIEGSNIIFLAKGSPNKAPTLLADFNGFLNPRYVKDTHLGAMKPISGTSWYYFEKTLTAEAIIHYQFIYKGTPITDPLNPLIRNIFGRLVSEVRMPEAQLAEVITDYSIPKGRIIQEKFHSKILGHERTIHIYLPYSYSKATTALPSVYFHDGTYYVERALVPQIIDKMIAQKAIPPLLAVFDDPVIRGKEYRGDSAYMVYWNQELIPHISSKYNGSTKSNDRAVIGGSRGGQSALYLAHFTDKFANCAAFSPAIHPESIPDFTSKLKSYNHSPAHVFITGSTYDYIWYNDAIELKAYFEETDINLNYLDIHAGHNIPAWRSMLDEILRAFFGDKKYE